MHSIGHLPAYAFSWLALALPIKAAFEINSNVHAVYMESYAL